jgi:hypothetical protein
MKSPSVVAGTAFAAPISRAYDDPTPQQDEDSMVSNISIENDQKTFKFLFNRGLDLDPGRANIALENRKMKDFYFIRTRYYRRHLS